ncbi:nucleoside triphosphate pyrophosphohydrolase family protein [Sphingomonas sp. Ag1]|jgi:NTP pyrophosphatase (non-canonical NTP hydrolase)|uniref:nucleoside triphosphate pyrophosphohydrolase family protein n=1 Tax=Sphingomonas sp. Ag1 TaxID=1642949 RepID=UPI000697A168|nr:nucleoside triphosphate pyrophosphohydrolase family protein [Sphingomonas sp. Ag1]
MTALMGLDQVRRQLAPRRNFTGDLMLDEYQRYAGGLNRTGLRDDAARDFLMMGLFGETGSLLSEVKKKQRDKRAYLSYRASSVEELGDVLWYFANVAKLVPVKLSDLAARAVQSRGWGFKGSQHRPRTFTALQEAGRNFGEPASGRQVERRLLVLAGRVGALVEIGRGPNAERERIIQVLVEILRGLIAAADIAHLSLDEAAQFSLAKSLDRFPSARTWGEPFDNDFDADEQLPRRMEITFREKLTPNGAPYVIQQWHGINIGDRLTDNAVVPDDYRYHDVFHLSYVAFLGWSPVMRSLLRLKRKSRPEIDEQQDGARAIITEEGISNWIFAHGLRHHAFEGVTGLDYGLLKTIRQMVKGYEVEARPLWTWEEAIIRGFEVFRELRKNKGGVVVADMIRHRLTYRALK